VKYRGLDTGCMSACNQYPTLRTSHRLFQGNFVVSCMHKQPFDACFQIYCTYLVVGICLCIDLLTNMEIIEGYWSGSVLKRN